MKKQLPTSKNLFTAALMLLFALSSTEAQTPISNGNFENWEEVPVAFIPDEWQVEKDHEAGDLVNTQMMESTEGTYSLKLTTILDPDNSEPLMGYAVLGEVGETGPEGGIPWTEEVDELRFDVKYSTEGSDATLALVQVFDATGSLIGGGTASYTGIQDPTNNWNSESIPLDYTGTPAEIMIGFISSNYNEPGNITEDSWMQIDNVELFNQGIKATTPIPNFSFESWSDLTIYDPIAWSSTNMELSEDGIANVTRTTNAVEGSYAAKLENIQRSDYVMSGAMTYGELPWNSSTSYPDKPDFLIGAYNYTPAGGDMGRIHVSFEDASDASLGNGLFDFEATSGYETFILPLSYWDTNATDHVIMGIGAGNTPVAGSVLLVDDFQFVNGYEVLFTVQDNASPTPNKLENATIDIETYKPINGIALTSDLNGEKLLKLPNGTYNITVTHQDYDDYNGTITVDNASTNKDIIMSVATQIENKSQESVNIFPNPASDELSIRAWQIVKRIKIINMNGLVILDQQTNGQKSGINISKIPTGQYLIQLETAQKTISKTIMIAR